MEPQVDTGKLRDIALEVIKDELPGLVQSAVETAFKEWKAQGSMVTQTDVERTIDRKIGPIQSEVTELRAAVAEVTGAIRDVSSGINSLRSAIDLIQQIPNDIRENRAAINANEARIATSEQAIKQVSRDNEMTMVAVANTHKMVWGDRDRPDSPSLMKDMRNMVNNLINEQTAQLMTTIGPMKLTVDSLAPQVAENSRFVKRRKEVEKAALGLFAVGKALWQDHKRLAIGIGVSTGIIAVLTHPEVQSFLTALMESIS